MPRPRCLARLHLDAVGARDGARGRGAGRARGPSRSGAAPAAARETHKLATSLWLVGARDAARQAWEAAGLLDAGTLLGTANALRLSQIVESLHGALRTLPPPDALTAAGRAHAPLLLVVDDDDALARELPIEAAVRGWRAKVIRHLAVTGRRRPGGDRARSRLRRRDRRRRPATGCSMPIRPRRSPRWSPARPTARGSKRTASPRRGPSASRSPPRRWSRRPPS